MIRVAVVDDDEQIRKTMNAYLIKYEQESSEKFQLSFFDDASKIVEDYKPVYDVIFMDIEMEHMDGMTGAEKIRQLDKDVIIIFVTNMADFAINGYKVDAMSYVVKPISYVDFIQQIKKAIKRIDNNKTSYLIVQSSNEIIRLDISKICYLEKRDHKVVIKMESKEIIISGSIKKMEERLEGYPFARCNSGYLVNLAHVEGIEQDMVKIDENLLPISRPKKRSFMSALSDYIGGDYR